MNLKKQALNSIIKAMRKNPKGRSVISFYTALNDKNEENNKVILTDSYAFMILPCEELSIKDMERIESIFYKVNVFQKRDCDYVKFHRQPLIESQHQLIDLLNEYYFDKHVFNIKMKLSSTEVTQEDDILLIYENDDYSNHNVRYINKKYQPLIHNPKTYDDSKSQGLLLSILNDSIITGVLPVKKYKNKDGMEE
jgi:hypothetical protein